MTVEFSNAEKAMIVRHPENVADLYRPLWQRRGMLVLDDVRPFLDRLACFGLNGRRGATLLARHFDRLAKGTDFVTETLGQPDSVRVVNFGGLQVKYCDDDFASRTFFDALMKDGHIHELGVVKLMLRTLAPDDIFIDVGAHTGYLSCIAGAKGAVVLAIELQQSIIPIIRRNAMINGLDRVHAITAAAGARDGLTSVLRYQPTLSGRAFGEGEAKEFASLGNNAFDWIPVVRLDTLAADLPQPPKLVKIDGEGAELQILAGARELIAGRRTRFILEFHVTLVAEFGGRREDLYPIFPADQWAVFQIEDSGLRRLDRASLHALLDPQVHGGANPSLLFDPIR
ncbi:MAG: FkbM family methyltransferase [Thalassobaculaceae bacterium]|nr:FkbM family methyltransferase [Thalassobaculaceae bacterium]